ncbi:MAG TPA: ABC-2 transporter permease [Mobilitalea sp.]|nr:ABC-2 transporter permease [Mobilitalea sp.]
MKGLILKDFINLKKNLKIFGGLTVLYGVMAIASDDTSFFSSIFVLLYAILTLSLYSYDDMAKWDVFAQTCPISKDNIVQSKYLMMLLLTLLGVVYGSLFTIIINIIIKSDSLLNGLQSIGAGTAIVILFYCIIIPFITKMGVEKARLILFAVYAIPFVIVLAMNKMLSNGDFVVPEMLIKLANTCMEYIYLIVPIVVIIALSISYGISVLIYQKKEF